MTDAAYRATLERLYQLRRFGMRPGLEVMQGLLGALGNPEASFPALHVAGSKGKGSVSAMAASILSAAGLKVGLFTSPHLVSYRERIRIGREPIAPEAVTKGVGSVLEQADRLVARGAIERPPTFFEITTAVAFDAFRAAEVDVAVVEVGLGGRLDSTNVVHAPVGVLTALELEHTEILGPTLTDIAREKAGILKPGMHGVVGELRPEAAREVERSASAAGVPLLHLGRELRVEERRLDERGQTLTVVTPHGRHEGLRVPLFGEHQALNAALAVGAVEALAPSLPKAPSRTAYRQGLRSVVWRARLECVAQRPPLYLDVAHTPDSARAAASGLVEIRPFLDPAENAVLFGCLEDKRVEEIFEVLSPFARTVVLVPVRSTRAKPVSALQRAAVGRFPRIVVAPDAPRGLALARAATGPDGVTLALGSDYLIGELLRHLEGAPEDEPDLSDPVAAPGAGR